MNSKKIGLLAIVVAGCTILLFQFAVRPSDLKFVPTGETSRPVALAKQGIGLPVNIKIPAINIDAAIENVGITSGGAMDVPNSPSVVAWFDLGPRPGETGSAVLAGHFGWKNGIPAAFDNLHKLQKGDKIYIENDDGTVATFVVREFQTYGQHEDTSGVFRSSDGKAHLNLITCEGVWNNVQKSYSNRLVVFADAVI